MVLPSALITTVPWPAAVVTTAGISWAPVRGPPYAGWVGSTAKTVAGRPASANVATTMARRFIRIVAPFDRPARAT